MESLKAKNNKIKERLIPLENKSRNNLVFNGSKILYFATEIAKNFCENKIKVDFIHVNRFE